MFNVGEKLTSQEMAERLGLEKKTFANQKKKYMEHLSHYYIIEEEGNGKAKRYIIKEQLADYEPYMSPADRRKKQNTYNEIILEEISKPGMNLQLYSTMNRRVRSRKEVWQFNHKEGTSYKYTTDGMKEMFGKDMGDWGTQGRYAQRVWAKSSENSDYDFEKLTIEEENKWKELIRYYNGDSTAEIHNLYKIGEISKQEHDERVLLTSWEKYLLAENAFAEIFGFIPSRVKEYLVAPEEAKIAKKSEGFIS